MATIADAAVAAWRTAREMVRDRGLPVDDADDEAVRAAAAADTSPCLVIGPGSCLVLHLEEGPLRKEQLAASLAAPALGAPSGAWPALTVLATLAPLAGATVRSLTAAATAAGSRLNVFTLRELQFNITRHAMVPPHRLLTDAEVSELMIQLRLSSKFSLPVILSTDPVARYMGLEPGSVVAVARPSAAAGRSTAFRVCKLAAPERSR